MAGNINRYTLSYQAPPGGRLHRYFMWVSVLGMCWNSKTKQWVESTEEWDSTCLDCRTLRAFKKVLRKHPQIIGRATLVNRYVGFDVKAEEKYNDRV